MDSSKESSIISSLDAVKDSQDNHCFPSINGSGGIGSTTGMSNAPAHQNHHHSRNNHRKNNYHNNYSRYNRQGGYGYNNGYNNHMNGYNNGYNNNYGGGGRYYGNKRHYYHNDHYSSSHQNFQNQNYFQHHNNYHFNHQNYSRNNNYFNNDARSNYNSVPVPHGSNSTQGSGSLQYLSTSSSSSSTPGTSSGLPSPVSSNTNISRPGSAISHTSSSSSNGSVESDKASIDSLASAYEELNLNPPTAEEDKESLCHSSPLPVTLFSQAEDSSTSKTDVSTDSHSLSITEASSNGLAIVASGDHQQIPNYGHKSFYSYPPNAHGHGYGGHRHSHIHCHSTSDSGGNLSSIGNRSHHSNQAQQVSEQFQSISNGRYFRDPPFEIFSPQGQFSTYPIFQTAPLDNCAAHSQSHHHVHSGNGNNVGGGPPLNSVTYSAPHFLFPEIQIAISESSKLNGDPARPVEWIYTEADHGGDSSCMHIPVPEFNHGNLIPNSQASFQHQRRRSGGNQTAGQYDGRHVSPTGQNNYNRRVNNQYGARFYDKPWPFTLTAFRIEELIEKYNYVGETDKPLELTPPGHELEKLSEQIWIKFQNNQQTVETYRKKLELWRDLSDAVRRCNPYYRLEMVGSTISGFGSNTSDVDMCLLLNHRNEQDPRQEALDVLTHISPMIDALPSIKTVDLIGAKVPILKLRDVLHNFDIDINVNNAVGLRNTHLLHAYSQCDWRVRPLVIVVKLWAQTQGINDAKAMTLSSYSYSLMVIHYLQAGVSPSILPCLQTEYAEKFSSSNEVWKVKRMLMDEFPKFKSENTQCLGELFLGFLEYFALKFDYRNCAVSVRTGSTVSVRQCTLNRAPKNDTYQWKHIAIEEPFEFTNTARSVFERESFDRIRGVFLVSWQRLMSSHDLDTIFNVIPHGEIRSAISGRGKS